MRDAGPLTPKIRAVAEDLEQEAPVGPAATEKRKVTPRTMIRDLVPMSICLVDLRDKSMSIRRRY